MNPPVHVAVTGAAGQIGYSLLFRIAAGAMLGPDQPVVLHLIEIEPALRALQGVVMELEDCAFPLLHGVVPTASLDEGFKGVHWALLVGSVPRKAGMERRDLLGINGRIFTAQGRAIARNAASDVRILVVGNPCNTNCLIAMHHAREIPAPQWFAMTMLDQNRARSLLARKAGAAVTAVSRLAIWGNHSPTMYPDFPNARIDGRPAPEVIRDEVWFTDAFLPAVQRRGAAILEARGASSAASAACAIVDTVRALTTPTPASDCFSAAIASPGAYGITPGLIFSYPLRSDGRRWSVVDDLPVNAFSRGKLAATENELKAERAMIAELLE